MQYIFGIGVQKAATSWLHAMLSAHPEIDGSLKKEVDFFSYYFDRGYQWFNSFFHGTAQFRIDVSPSYFVDPRAARRIFEYAPTAKIILLLRDPVERAFSNHTHEIMKGHIAPCGFFEAMANNPMYIEQSLYTAHLRMWLDYFPPEQIRVIWQEDIKDNKHEILTALYKFIGVDAEYCPAIMDEMRNVSDVAKLPLLRKFTRSLGGILRKLGMENLLARIKSYAPIAWMLHANAISVKDLLPELTTHDRERLNAYFYEDLKNTRKLILQYDLTLKF